jgi:predicted nucleic acid-binding Zn ribbon protein
MSKLSQIYEGWKNNLFPLDKLKDKILEVSSERMAICESCKNHSKNHKTIRPDNHCVSCGCTLSAKTKCLSCKCPIDKWSEVLTKEQEKNYESNIAI